jgi:lipopolysaccharide transport system ATP-binding protein
MSNTAIDVERLGKLYRIGPRERYRTMRDVLTAHIYAPFRRLRFGRQCGTAAARNSPKDANNIWALRDVSFKVTQGEVLGIIGRNGAGKSTLLKILSRITRPTEGRAEIHGSIGSLLEVGTGFHPELTGRENIYLNGAILGMKRGEIARKFDDIVSFAEIEKFMDTPVKHYSSGMYLRLAFAVAAHLDPEILLVDEVLAVGDHEFRKKCLGKMGDMSREGRTVLLVSHNLPSIVSLCQRAILLNAGRVVREGQAAAVVQQYLSTVRSAVGEVVWPDPAQAPGNDIVRLHAVRILQDGMGTSTADVDIAKEVLIQIEYWNLREGNLLYPAIWLRDQIGTFVLSSSNSRSVSLTEDRWNGAAYPMGLFQSVCRIPGDFLNEGVYSITAIVGRGVCDTQVVEDYAVSFHVQDTGEMRKEFFGEWIGTVRPRLAWRTERLSAKVVAVECHCLPTLS